MPFIARCTYCGTEHRCRDRAHGKTIRCRECAHGFVAQNVAASERGLSLPTRRRRQKSAKKKSSEVPEGKTSQPLLTRRSIYIGCCLVALTSFGASLLFANPLGPAMRKALQAVAAVATYVVYDQYNRQLIQSEIESLGGHVESISWRPFQGAFFSRGWGRQKIYRFYCVRYRERDSTEKSELCGVNLLLGLRWDWD